VLKEHKIEQLNRDMISIAFATNNSKSMLEEDDKLDTSIVVNNEAVINLDKQLGIKVNQVIEEDFKLTDTGFTNVKSKF
jgi:hypothetical protein